MSLMYPFTNVGFFFKHDTEDRIGNLAYSENPASDDGSIFFEKPVRSVEHAICVANNKEKNNGYVATFPRINTFPEDEEFHRVIKGKYLLPDDAPPNTIPYMILRGAHEHCVCIQVLIKSE